MKGRAVSPQCCERRKAGSGGGGGGGLNFGSDHEDPEVGWGRLNRERRVGVANLPWPPPWEPRERVGQRKGQLFSLCLSTVGSLGCGSRMQVGSYPMRTPVEFPFSG